ncbi:hypothetical protein H5410_037367 [Solanum commersonii]|uniref:Uncharacterized protein n=1 Tax=Solanum commersonii TaxID=4109 RepID=A0A9J5Y8A2_SOLCO|nr:hypothetical protein H5410_037367 [Solanum commersonii]
MKNEGKFEGLPTSSKDSISAAGEESNNISGQLTPTSIHCPSPLIEGDIDPLFPPISIFNQNGRGSKKHRKRGFTDMEMQ